VDAEGKNGVTPLHVAVHYDNTSLALLLLEKASFCHTGKKYVLNMEGVKKIHGNYYRSIFFFSPHNTAHTWVKTIHFFWCSS
jgi:hypothetical protein